MNETREHQREKLLRAACDLAAEHGIAALRTRDIAARAGVAVATLHYCFATKQELLRELYLFIFAEFRRAVERLEMDYLADRETLEGQMWLRLAFLRSSDSVHLAWRAFTREAWTDPLVRPIVSRHFEEQRSRFERILARRRVDAGISAPPAVPDNVAAAVIVGAFEGLTLQWGLDRDAIDPDEYVRSIFALIGLNAQASL